MRVSLPIQLFAALSTTFVLASRKKGSASSRAMSCPKKAMSWHQERKKIAELGTLQRAQAIFVSCTLSVAVQVAASRDHSRIVRSRLPLAMRSPRIATLQTWSAA